MIAINAAFSMDVLGERDYAHVGEHEVLDEWDGSIERA